jgi:hypothetical protein
MTRQPRPVLAVFRHSGTRVRGGGGTARSGKTETAAERAGSWAGSERPSRERASRERASREPAGPVPGTGTVGAVVYLAVLACVAAGLYIAWRLGSAGGGRGAAVAGGALLVAAIARLVLPARLAGLLASRRRAIDVLTLTVFGAGLLVAGLVLPRLGPLSAQGRMAGPPMKGKHG